MPTHYVVRYGAMRHLGDFAARGQELARTAQVIVRSHRGTEWGEVLCPATERTREYLGGEKEAQGKILRQATPEDERIRDRLWQQERDLFHGCRESITERHMPMQLVDAEQLFGGEKIVFYYTAETRVDFRELVKALAKKFHSRIEMRQIGIRDEAKLLADYGDCGKPTCCNTFLQEMPPVSMKMAKLQKASLDPNKISGRCGRLKCCLRYEYDTYEEHRRELPGVGKWIMTRDGKGRVLAQEILARKVLVAFEDDRRILVDAAEVVTVISGASS
jgi:cell fate regulator YaaT (PSP1 superfamily)